MSIHPTAVVSPKAEIGSEVEIGPYATIGDDVKLGPGNVIHQHVTITGHTSIGSGNAIFPGTIIGTQPQDLKFHGEVSYLEIGDNNTFREYVTVHSATDEGDATVIGSHNNLLAYTHVAHDCQLGDHIVMSNVATLAGHVTVEDRAIIGGLAAVHQFCRIGTMSIIGGCSKVVQDIPPYMMADGNPATTRALNKEGLKRNEVSAESQAALKQAHRILFRENLTSTKGVDKTRAEVPASDEIEHLLTFIESSQRGIAR